MKISKLLTILVLLLCFGATTSVMAQGRKREHRNQRGGRGFFHFKKSGGHADSFAKGGKKKGFFAKVFKGNKSGSAWTYHKTKPGAKQNREQPKLFTRNRTKAKRYRDPILARQNRQRTGTRVRGNATFGKSKH